MFHRFIQTFVVVFWLASMGWLISTKIVPSLGTRSRPEQRAFQLDRGESLNVEAWRIRWNHRPIGWARTRTQRHQDGLGHVDSVVRLENLTARMMLKEMFGTGAFMLRTLNFAGVDEELEIGCRITTEMNFSTAGDPTNFHSRFDVDSFGELLTTRGAFKEEKLRVDVRAGSAIQGMPLGPLADLIPGAPIANSEETEGGDGADEKVLISREFDIAPSSLVADSLLPQSRLAGLKVGQRWVFQSYRAYPPQNPVRDIEAKVERHEMLGWDDGVEPVFVVSFRDISGSGLTANSEPNSWLWVQKSGRVLKQELRIGNVMVEFRRCDLSDLPDEESSAGEPEKEAVLSSGASTEEKSGESHD